MHGHREAERLAGRKVRSRAPESELALTCRIVFRISERLKAEVAERRHRGDGTAREHRRLTVVTQLLVRPQIVPQRETTNTLSAIRRRDRVAQRGEAEIAREGGKLGMRGELPLEASVTALGGSRNDLAEERAGCRLRGGCSGRAAIRPEFDELRVARIGATRRESRSHSGGGVEHPHPGVVRSAIALPLGNPRSPESFDEVSRRVSGRELNDSVSVSVDGSTGSAGSGRGCGSGVVHGVLSARSGRLWRRPQ